MRSSKLEPVVVIKAFMTRSPSQPDLPTFWAPVDISRAAFVAANAVVMGNVSIAYGRPEANESGVSIWYGAVVRGDVERIEIGSHTNIQDGAIIHGDPGKPTILESYVTVGHRAVIHSAYIETGCLIGIGAIVLDGVRVGSGSIIGAGCVVTKDVPPRSLMVGIPAKCLRQIDDAEAQGLIIHAQKYAQLALVHAGKGTDLGFK
jgi:carbonic anhydrase/acetyltransferase-like protein (isoleucine patch superfamily)